MSIRIFMQKGQKKKEMIYGSVSTISDRTCESRELVNCISHELELTTDLENIWGFKAISWLLDWASKAFRITSVSGKKVKIRSQSV